VEKKAKKEREREMKKKGDPAKKGKRRQLIGGKTVDDFVLRVLGSREFLTKGNEFIVYDDVRKCLNKHVPVNLRFVDIATAQPDADEEEQSIIDRAVATDYDSRTEIPFV